MRSFFPVVAVLLVGCSPGWKVIRSTPTSLDPAVAKGVAVHVDFSQLQVEKRSEAEWVEQKTKNDPKYAETWADLKARFEKSIVAGFKTEYPQAIVTAEPPPGSLHITVKPRAFRMGHYTVVSSPPSALESLVSYSIDGQSVDDISIYRSIRPTVTLPSVWTHIEPIGNSLGDLIGEYVKQRK